MPDAAPKTAEDKILPAVVYGLYLVSVPSAFLSMFLGLVIAYVARGNAGPMGESHYTFLIGSFWKTFGWRIIAGLMILVGLVFTVFLIGIPVMITGFIIWGLVELWFIVRCVVGLLHLAKGEAYPRPHAWLI